MRTYDRDIRFETLYYKIALVLVVTTLNWSRKISQDFVV